MHASSASHLRAGRHHQCPAARLIRPSHYGNIDLRLYGRWETVIPAADGAAIDKVLGMQTVHTMLLPSGKVFLASGSSWRNHVLVEFFPANPNPRPGSGVFIKADGPADPFLKSNRENYYQIVNNVAIYDPANDSRSDHFGRYSRISIYSPY